MRNYAITLVIVIQELSTFALSQRRKARQRPAPRLQHIIGQQVVLWAPALLLCEPQKTNTNHYLSRPQVVGDVLPALAAGGVACPHLPLHHNLCWHVCLRCCHCQPATIAPELHPCKVAAGVWECWCAPEGCCLLCQLQCHESMQQPDVRW